MLVIKRIKQILHITAEGRDRETIERVLEVYADSCPVAASVKGSIEISSELDLRQPEAYEVCGGNQARALSEVRGAE